MIKYNLDNIPFKINTPYNGEKLSADTVNDLLETLTSLELDTEGIYIFKKNNGCYLPLKYR